MKRALRLLSAFALTACATYSLVERVAVTIAEMSLLRLVLERRVREATDPPQQVQCLERLAALDSKAGDVARAATSLRQATDLARGIGDDATAIAMLCRLRELDPHDASATSQLIELYDRAGEFSSIPALMHVLLNLAQEPTLRLPLLRALTHTLAEKLNELPAAFATASSAFEIAPFDNEVRAAFESLAVRIGAVKEFAKAIDIALLNPPDGTKANAVDLTLAKARALATQAITMPDAALTYREVLGAMPSEARSVGIPLGLELSATIVVKRALRLLSAFALTACATYSLEGNCDIVRSCHSRDYGAWAAWQPASALVGPDVRVVLGTSLAQSEYLNLDRNCVIHTRKSM